MTSIGNVDRILLLLREQLQRAAEEGPRIATSRKTSGSGEQRPLDRARTLASMEAIDPDQRRRLIVRTLLLEQFGEAIGTDPAFAPLVDRVVAMVRDIPGGNALIDQAFNQLREQRP